ncbi:flap endonuclease-1 [Methanophagales archaeon]|nr:flap endonuclease-1 [Methanophagales archaeon]
MGVNIREIVELRETNLGDLSGKIVAVDAYNTLYQFLSIIRQPDGTPLADSSGRTTSHLSGLIYRTTNLMEAGLKLVFVFDGKPSKLKADVIKARSERREAAMQKWEEAKVLFPKDAFKYAQASTRIDATIVADAKTLLTFMGIPYVQAPSEGEAQAAYMAQNGDAELVSSQDYDSLLFGAPITIRNLSSPRKKAKLELVELKALENTQGIIREELIDIAILVGTDFNEGIKGVGVKRARKLIKKHRCIENILKSEAAIDTSAGIENYRLVRELFLHPDVTESYDELKWGTPDAGKIKELLCEVHEFSEERVGKALEKVLIRERGQKSIEQWL